MLVIKAKIKIVRWNKWFVLLNQTKPLPSLIWLLICLPNQINWYDAINKRNNMSMSKDKNGSLNLKGKIKFDLLKLKLIISSCLSTKLGWAELSSLSGEWLSDQVAEWSSHRVIDWSKTEESMSAFNTDSLKQIRRTSAVLQGSRWSSVSQDTPTNCDSHQALMVAVN